MSAMVFLLAGLSIYYIHMRRTVPMSVVPKKRPIVTVFIHGTFHLPIMPKPLIRFVHTCIDTFIFSKKGLHKVTALEEHYNQGWVKKFHNYQMIKTISDAKPEKFPFESFYIFCWSGQLCPQKRLSAAQKLHAALKQLTTEYTNDYGIEPYIQLITHSHGGNVALNLARIDEDESTSFSIDELILLACPVQHETSYLIHHDMFKKAYSLHSHWDMIQVIDAQGWIPFKERVKKFFTGSTHNTDDATHAQESSENKCFFSERHFCNDPKLIQANINYGLRGMLHVEFISESFMQQLPALLASLDAQKSHYAPTEDNADLYIDLNPMIKQARRDRLAKIKELKKNRLLAQQQTTTEYAATQPA